MCGVALKNSGERSKMRKKVRRRPGCGIGGAPDRKVTWNNLLYAVDGETIGRARSPDRAGAVRKQKIRFVAARHPSKKGANTWSKRFTNTFRSSSTKSRNGRDHSLQVGL